MTGDNDSSEDDQAAAVLAGLAGLRRCPQCHDGLMVRLLRVNARGWGCAKCLYLVLDEGWGEDVAYD